MKLKKIFLISLCILSILSLSGCKFPELFYKTPSLKRVQSEEVQTKVIMPDLSGLTYSQAVEQTKNIPLIVTKQYNDKVSKNKISWQSVNAGEEISIGTPVNIVISKGVQLIEIPDVSDMDYLAAQTVLKSLGFKVKIKYQHKWGTESGDIISLSPQVGKKKPYGSTVNMTVDAVDPSQKKAEVENEQ